MPEQVKRWTVRLLGKVETQRTGRRVGEIIPGLAAYVIDDRARMRRGRLRGLGRFQFSVEKA